MSLQDIPIYPPALNLSDDDFVAVIDNSDNRSPKRLTVGQLADYVNAEGNAATALPLEAESDDDKMLLNPLIGSTVRVTFEGNRIERLVGGFASGFFITNVGTYYPLEVLTEATETTKAYFGQGEDGVWYADWDDSTADSWSLTSSDGIIWSSEDNVDSPLEVVNWTKVYVEEDEEDPLYPALPTLTECVAANQNNWIVERNTVALTVDTSASAQDVTINGVLCEALGETAQFVGWVDPLNISISAESYFTVTGFVLSNNVESAVTIVAPSSILSLPALPDRIGVQIYIQ
jgi:hypothetical protein